MAKPILLIRRWPVMGLGLIVLIGLVVACANESKSTAPALLSAAPPNTATPQSVPTPTPVPFKILKANPERGIVGTTFTISGEGMPAEKTVEFQWTTMEGSYGTKSSPETVEFYERQYVEKRVVLGRADVDAQGKVSANFTAPEDFGEVHDIYARIDEQDIARGGFRILRAATITPTEGPLGAPISIKITGLAWKPFEGTLALRYDNKYMGFVSAVTTKGTANFQIRAAGPVGQHLIQVIQSSSGQPYLNVEQSPVAGLWTQIPSADFRATFTVTKDAGAPPATLERPSPKSVSIPDSVMQRTSATYASASTGIGGSAEPFGGPILSPSTVYANGLPPNTELELLWVTARGNRVSPSGWNLVQTPLVKTTTSKEGTLTASIKVPEDLGGWHTVKIVQGEKVLTEIPYYVERSLVGVTPQRVKVGEKFTIQVKGIGWTELDNGFAVTYDNGYIGYACGFNSNGDVTMNLVATGGPGTHLIDIYPMIFQGHGKPPWTYQVPQLTALADHPGLVLGYRLPIYRLAIEVSE